jgi:cysteinyl-tRNA synthetase
MLMALKLFNTPDKKIEEFTSQIPGKVTLYTCGPTVYDHLTVGNWSAYIYWDTLVRVLRANDFIVDRVMNITDVGHLTSDADEGEDKLEKGAKREGKTAWDIATFYGNEFLDGMNDLNLLTPEHITKATDYIPQQLELIRKLKAKGFTYQIDDGIYYDTSKFPAYADFAGLDLDAQRAGARVTFNDEKRNPSDFAVWKFTATGEKRDMEWLTPKDILDENSQTSHADARQGESEHQTESYTEYDEGGAQDSTQHSAASDSGAASSAGRQAITVRGSVKGFPGWHLECSAMAMDILGETLDIHTGGIDHIPVHHTNEIAQSEAVTGKKFSNYWLHNNHLKVDGTKISKSLGNGYTLKDLEERGYSEMDFRMFVLQGHYRNEGNFTFDNLTAAKNRLLHWRNVAALRHQTPAEALDGGTDNPALAIIQEITQALDDDLNTPLALSIIDEVFSHLESNKLSELHHDEFVQLLEAIDSLLGLRIIESTPDIDNSQKQIIVDRERERADKDWTKSDELRDQLAEQGIVVRDTADGSIWEYQ